MFCGYPILGNHNRYIYVLYRDSIVKSPTFCQVFFFHVESVGLSTAQMNWFVPMTPPYAPPTLYLYTVLSYLIYIGYGLASQEVGTAQIGLIPHDFATVHKV